jgi:GNAT superfamily N-acetyltransferase
MLLPNPYRIQLFSHREIQDNTILCKGLYDLYLTCFVPASQEEVIPLDDFLGEIAGFHDESLINYLIFFSDSQVIGMLSLFPYVKSIFLSNFCIKPSYRKLGFGRLLIAAAASYAASVSVMSLSGTVDGTQQILEKYYSGFGARKIQLGVSNTDFVPSRFNRSFSEQEVKDFTADALKRAKFPRGSPFPSSLKLVIFSSLVVLSFFAEFRSMI